MASARFNLKIWMLGPAATSCPLSNALFSIPFGYKANLTHAVRCICYKLHCKEVEYEDISLFSFPEAVFTRSKSPLSGIYF